MGTPTPLSLLRKSASFMGNMQSSDTQSTGNAATLDNTLETKGVQRCDFATPTEETTQHKLERPKWHELEHTVRHEVERTVQREVDHAVCQQVDPVVKETLARAIDKRCEQSNVVHDHFVQGVEGKNTCPITCQEASPEELSWKRITSLENRLHGLEIAVAAQSKPVANSAPGSARTSPSDMMRLESLEHSVEGLLVQILEQNAESDRLRNMLMEITSVTTLTKNTRGHLEQLIEQWGGLEGRINEMTVNIEVQARGLDDVKHALKMEHQQHVEDFENLSALVTLIHSSVTKGGKAENLDITRPIMDATPRLFPNDSGLLVDGPCPRLNRSTWNTPPTSTPFTSLDSSISSLGSFTNQRLSSSQVLRHVEDIGDVDCSNVYIGSDEDSSTPEVCERDHGRSRNLSSFFPSRFVQSENKTAKQTPRRALKTPTTTMRELLARGGLREGRDTRRGNYTSVPRI